MNIDDRPATNDRRPTSGPIHTFCIKLQTAITLQRVNRSPSCLVLGWGCRGRRIQRRHFRLDQIQDGGRQPSWKNSNSHKSLKRIIGFNLRMYTDHTLTSDSILTVDAYDRRLDTYCARQGIDVKKR